MAEENEFKGEVVEERREKTRNENMICGAPAGDNGWSPDRSNL